MTTNPLISCIVPVYNVERFLRDCIDSVISQTLEDFELILIDDGSSNNCPKICDEYASKDKRIIVVHTKNNGVSSARNSGLDIAHGKWICFIDGDDWVEPDYFEYLLSLAEENNVDLAQSDSMFVSASVVDNYDFETVVCNSEQCTSNMLLHKYPIGVYCKLFLKKLLDDNKIRFFTDVFIGEGFNFNMLAFQYAKKIVVGHKKIYHYRTDNAESAVTKFKIEKWENAFFALDKISDNLVLKTKLIENSMKYAYWYDYGYVLNLLYKNNVYKMYPIMREKCVLGLRHLWYVPFVLKTNWKQKLKSILFLLAPNLFFKLKNGK